MTDPEPATPASPVRHEVRVDLAPHLDVDSEQLLRVWVQVQQRIADNAPTTTLAERVIDTIEPLAIPALALALKRDSHMVRAVLGHVEDLAVRIETMIRDL
jgi:hypothetical protein